MKFHAKVAIQYILVKLVSGYRTVLINKKNILKYAQK